MKKLWHWYLALTTAWKIAMFGIVISVVISTTGFLIKHYFFTQPTPPDPPDNQNSIGDGNTFNQSPVHQGTGNQTINYNRDPLDRQTIQNQHQIINDYREQLQERRVSEQDQKDYIQQLEQTITELQLLAKGEGAFAQQAREALDQLGKTQGQELLALAQSLEQLTQTYEQKRSTNDRIAAQLYRGRGALAFAHDTQTALRNYQRATELDPQNLDGWNQLGHLQHRVGRLDAAIASYQKVETLATTPIWRAVAYGNLGNSYYTRGDLKQAEKFHRKALIIDEALGNKEGIARHNGNLGNLYQTRGDLEQAEKFHCKALTIDEALGNKEGIARHNGNLGNLYQTRGDLEQAKVFYRQSLAISEELGNKEAIASIYGNLGIIYKTRGNLEQAEVFYRQSLAISEELGRKGGMANKYGNLGNIYKTRGNLEQAEVFYRQSLAINEELKRKEGMANQYGNLGLLYQTRGDLEQAREYWHKALALYEKIGMPHQAQKVRDLLK